MGEGASNVVVCQSWPYHEEFFADVHYHRWRKHCSCCGKPIVVTTVIVKRIRLGETLNLVCQECAESDRISN
jgi:hypothetical protein